MNWKTYERKVFNELALLFPHANIQHNLRLPGRFSKSNRQVDILIAGIAVGVYYQIVVDTKYYNRKVDVKNVEEFIGMLGDLDCSHGMLIAEKGFTSGAANRAANNPFSVSIDIVSYSDLKEYQTTAGAIGFTDQHAVLIRPPLGWAIDARPEQRAYVASLYNRCFPNRDVALKAENFMYVMIESRSSYPTIQNLLHFQEHETTKRLPLETLFQYNSWKSDANREYTIRTIYRADA